MSTYISIVVSELCAAGVGFQQAQREFEKRYLLTLLRTHRGNQCVVAKLAGMHRNSLHRHLQEVGITAQELRKIREATGAASIVRRQSC